MKKFILAIVIALLSVTSYAWENVMEPGDKIYHTNGNVYIELIKLNEYCYEYNTYYEDGTLSSTGKCDEYGYKFGWWVSYYTNGTPSMKIKMSQNKYNGEYIYYNTDGNIIMIGTYRNGVKHGDFKMWDETGTLLLERRTYKRGKMETQYKWTETEGLIVKL